MVNLSASPVVSPATSATALVVDGNATSRRFVELALARGSFAVEPAADAAAAIEILATQVVDLVICDTDLPDTSGLALYRRLTQEHRLRHIPFVFLSADRAVATKVAALRAGADDYMVKPCDVAELVARAEALVGRQRRMRDALRARSYSLAGDFHALAFSDLVSTIEMGRRSGVLSVVTAQAMGRVYFDRGALVHATFGNLTGELAFHRIFSEPRGQFEFTPGECPVAQDGWTIAESVTGLIMESARILDDEARTSGPPRSSGSETFEIEHERVTKAPPNAAIVPALPADSILAAQLELALRDPFTLGELRLFTEADLGRWTRREVGGDRFHVLLVADLPAGVSSMLALGGAPTERWVLDSLTPAKKAFGLTFFLRHERVVDVILIDVNAPTSMLGSLGRAPAVVLFCPPDGDVFSLGIGPRAGLDELLDATKPTGLVGVGNAGLEQGLSTMHTISDGTTAVRCTSGALGSDDTEDLRRLIVKGIRLWASTSGRTRTTRPPGAS